MPFMCSNGAIPAMALSPVCVVNVPTPAGPIPVPAPNVAMSAVAVPTQFTTFTTAFPYGNLLTQKAVSIGTPGTGIVSGVCMGPDRTLVGSVKLFLSCMPTTRMLDLTAQNGMSLNSLGVNLTPSQVTVMCLT